MGIKGWFEAKIAERKAQQEARKQAMMVAARYEKKHRVSMHDGSKKGYKHRHGIGFITRWTHKDEKTGKKVTEYLHRDGWDAKIQTQHERVVDGRLKKDSTYLEKATEYLIANTLGWDPRETDWNHYCIESALGESGSVFGGMTFDNTGMQIDGV